jgi:NADPH:quinone reductase-like Zn-dependent oxidoreductase
MKAIRFHEFGGPEVLQLEDVPVPELAGDQVLIRVHAAGVNPIDWKIRSGAFRVLGLTLPARVGIDLAGVVERIGSSSSPFKVGDAVFGRGDGSYAEFAAASPEMLAVKPRSLDDVHAAAVPVVALTAWEALFGSGRAPSIDLAPGQTILIHGAGGGVGSFAVQFAKWRGARVLAHTRSHQADYVRSLGADVVIDSDRQRFEETAEKVDAVLDLVGGDLQQRSWRILSKGGVLASTVMPPPVDETAARGIRAIMVIMSGSRRELEQIGGLIDQQRVRVVVDAVLPLAGARRAHELSEGAQVRGKLVLQIA